MNRSGFNIRVYGIVFNSYGEILLTDEYRLSQKMTKFPGGGLEQGEGTIDCLHREFMEEMNQPIASISHFYTTDFYQKGWFFEHMQLISIYYLVELQMPLQFKISEKAFDFDISDENPQSFRWASLDSLRPSDLTFPIDKKVLEMLQKENMRRH
ncbi:MAG: NUDIX hydrolase [Salinivirgaceae bacterium]